MKKMYLSPDKKILGVCAGIADYLNVDPALIRAGVLCLAGILAFLPVAVVYFILSFVLPAAPSNYYQLVQNTGKKITKGADKKLAGVCSGVAEYLGCDATVIRLILAIAFLFFGYGIWVYIVGCIVLPQNSYQQPTQPTP